MCCHWSSAALNLIGLTKTFFIHLGKDACQLDHHFTYAAYKLVCSSAFVTCSVIQCSSKNGFRSKLYGNMNSKL